jgi:hypothetical protein
MLRNVALLLCLACLTLLGVLMIGCGSSSKSPSTACSGGPYNVVGDWNLTLNGFSGVAGVINATGSAVFFNSSAEVVVMPTITGACSFSGSATLYSPTNGSSTSTVTGTVNSATSFGGMYASGSSSGAFTAAAITPLTGAITVPSNVMTMADYDNVDVPYIQLTFSGTPGNMTFNSPSDSDCATSGTFTEENGQNVFDVSMTLSGVRCPISGTFTGLGFESNSDYFNLNLGAAGIYLYAVSSDSATVFEFAP